MTHVRRYEKNFSQETRELFRNNYECWICGKNCWDSFHHCLGGNFEEADSVFNAVPICNATCHIGKSFSEEEKSRLLKKTKEYLRIIGYELTKKDIKFLELKKRYYEKY